MRIFKKNIHLICCLVLVMSMLPDVPIWVVMTSLGLILLRIMTDATEQKRPSGLLISLLAIFLFLVTYSVFQTFLQLDAAASVLILAVGIKIFDFKSDRDEKLIFLLGFMLISVKALFTHDLVWMLPLLSSFYLLWYGLIQDSKKNQKSRLLLKMFLQSIPTTVFLFFIFPRLIVPWATIQQNKIGTIGFSDQMSPGQFEEIVGQNKNVFSVHFNESNSEYQSRQLYWRGMILAYSNGMSWERGQDKVYSNMNINEATQSYRVFIEPQMSNYLFSLEHTSRISSKDILISKVGPSYYSASSQVDRLSTYDGYFNFFDKDKTEPDMFYLQVPELQSKTKKWIQKVKNSTKSIEERIQILKDFFSDGSFFYSLKPGRYSENDLDDFLFSRRKGFCEHYAGAYATLARALGIPSRVIIGYQGGIKYEYGDLWKISSRDAHVWVEIYNKGNWNRVDPTAWVAPLRIELGGSAFYSLPEDEQNLALSDFSQVSSKNKLLWLYFQTTGFAQVINFKWNQWLNDFDLSSQQRLLAYVKENLLFFISIIIFTLATFYLGLYFIFKQKNKASQVEIIYELIVELAARNGLVKEISITPTSFLQLIAKKWTQSEKVILNFSRLYERYMYTSDKDISKHDLYEIKIQVKKLTFKG